MPKVNVIVPFYNVAEYIEECLASLCQQTFTDFTTYLVDSGSTDDSAELAEATMRQYQKPYQLLRLAGNDVSQARNLGLSVATDSPYIYFLDSDDCMQPQLLETLVGLMEDHQLDLAACMFQRVDQHRQPLGTFRETGIPLDVLINPRQNPAVLLTQVAVWNKLFSRRLLDALQLRFIEGYIYEDIHFTKTYLMACERVYYTETPLYDYRQRPKSLMQDSTNRNRDIVGIYDKLLSDLSVEQTALYRHIIEVAAFESILINAPVRLCRLGQKEQFQTFYEMPLVQHLMAQDHRLIKGFSWKYRLIYQLVKWRQLWLLSRLA